MLDVTKTLAVCLSSLMLVGTSALAQPKKQEVLSAPEMKTLANGSVVSSVVLNPEFSVPSKYKDYNRIELTELADSDLHGVSAAAFRSYGSLWVTQAASSDTPDWQRVAEVLYPDVRSSSNEFKKQEAGGRAKAETKTDKKSLNVVIAAYSNEFRIDGPDIKTGEYYLSLAPTGTVKSLYFDSNKPGVTEHYGYSPDLTNAGLVLRECSGSRPCPRSVSLTVKVPLQKAKEIEALREKGKDMFRIYGRVSKATDWQNSPSRIGGTLVVEGQAIEFGSRQNGLFKSYFFLDSDQLKRLTPKKEKAAAVFFGI